MADEHVKSGIVEGLRRRGVDIVTVQEPGLNETDDEVLLTEATRQGRLMLSCDASSSLANQFNVNFAITKRSFKDGRSQAGAWERGNVK